MKPKIPAKDRQWHSPVEIHNERVFGILTILRYCLRRIAPQSRWQARLEAIFERYPGIPTVAIGFPEGWERCLIWSGRD